MLEVDGWDWSYSFSLNAEPRLFDRYHEGHLQSRGACWSLWD